MKAFVPDQEVGNYLTKQTGRTAIARRAALFSCVIAYNKAV
jgi:hypothetical protein